MRRPCKLFVKTNNLFLIEVEMSFRFCSGKRCSRFRLGKVLKWSKSFVLKLYRATAVGWGKWLLRLLLVKWWAGGSRFPYSLLTCHSASSFFNFRSSVIILYFVHDRRRRRRRRRCIFPRESMRNLAFLSELQQTGVSARAKLSTRWRNKE